MAFGEIVVTLHSESGDRCWMLGVGKSLLTQGNPMLITSEYVSDLEGILLRYKFASNPLQVRSKSLSGMGG